MEDDEKKAEKKFYILSSIMFAFMMASLGNMMYFDAWGKKNSQLPITFRVVEIILFISLLCSAIIWTNFVFKNLDILTQKEDRERLRKRRAKLLIGHKGKLSKKKRKEQSKNYYGKSKF